MLIKITQPGWETYSGDLGCVPFENAVSLKDISEREALQLGSFITVVEVDADGNELGPVSPAHELFKASNLRAEVLEPLDRGSDEVVAEVEPEPAAEVEPASLHTESSLYTVADAEGIVGLRKIGDPLGARHTSIKGLIAEILKVQANPKVEA